MELLELILNEPMFDAIAITLLHFLWQGGLIAFGLYVFLSVVDQKLARVRYAASLVALSLTLVVPLITFNILQQPSFSAVSTNLQPVILEQLPGLSSSQVIEAIEWRDLIPLLSVIWIFGVIYFSCLLVYQLFNVYQLPFQSATQADETLQAVFDELAKRLKVNQFTRLVISIKAEVPMVIGWIRPVVLLPVSMTSGLTPSQLEMLLIHELAHIKRYDYLVNLFQSLVEVVFFFHPCVKWVSKQVRAEREYCCDDIAIKHCGCAVSYATTLTEAELLRPQNIPQLAMAASGGNLKKRIFRAVGHHSCAQDFTGQWLAGLISFLLVISIFVATKVTGISENSGLTEIVDINPHQPIPVIQNNPIVSYDVQKTAEQKNKKTTINSLNSRRAVEVDTTQTAYQLSVEKTAEQSLKQGRSQTALNIIDRKPLSSQKQSVDKVKSISLKRENNQRRVKEKAQSKPLSLLSEFSEKPAAENTLTKNTSHKKEVDGQSSLVKLAKLENEDRTKAEKKPNESQQLAKSELPSINKQSIDDTKQPEIEANFIKLNQPAKLIKSELPAFPTKNIRKNEQRDIQVEFVITDEGLVEGVEFIGGVHREFRKSVKRALRQWRFEPAVENGQKVVSKMTQVFSFIDPPEFSKPMTGSRL